MKRGQKFIVDINCPRMSDIRRPSISWLANRGGREREKTRVLVQGLYRSLEWKAKPEARFNQAIEKRAGARKIDGWGRHNNERGGSIESTVLFLADKRPFFSLRGFVYAIIGLLLRHSCLAHRVLSNLAWVAATIIVVPSPSSPRVSIPGATDFELLRLELYSNVVEWMKF